MSYPLLDTVNSPAELRLLERKQLPQLAQELREFLIESVVEDRRPPVVEPRHGGTDHRPALRLRHAGGSAGVGRRPPDLRPQGAHRPARRHGQAAHAGRRLGFPAPRREPLRHLRHGTFIDLHLRRPGHGASAHGTRASTKQVVADHRRWRNDRRHGLRGAEQRRRGGRQPARHPQR
jgi:hypothetical protein